MKKIIFLLSLFVTTAMTSCYTYNQGTAQSSVILTQPNYKVIKKAEGHAHATYILGIGGFGGKDELYARAKKDMEERNPLVANQAYVNMTTDVRTTTGLLIVSSVVVTVTADIIEFTTPTAGK